MGGAIIIVLLVSLLFLFGGMLAIKTGIDLTADMEIMKRMNADWRIFCDSLPMVSFKSEEIEIKNFGGVSHSYDVVVRIKTPSGNTHLTLKRFYYDPTDEISRLSALARAQEFHQKFNLLLID